MLRSSDRAPIPPWFTVVAVLVAVVLIGGAFVVGYQSALPPTVIEEESDDPVLPLAVPEMLGGYALAESELPPSPSPSPAEQPEVARATYTDGIDRLVLVLVRPEFDLPQLLTDAGVTDLHTATPEAEASVSPSPSPDAKPSDASDILCGRSADSGFAACARIVGETGQVLYAATDVDQATVEELLATVR